MTDNDTQRPWANLVRLKNGDDVVAQIVELSHDNIEQLMLFYPMKIVYTYSDEGYHVGFVPWVFHKICDKQEFTISKNDVLFYQEVETSMNESYWSAVDKIERSIINEEVKESDQEMIDDIMDLIHGLDKGTLH